MAMAAGSRRQQQSATNGKELLALYQISVDTCSHFRNKFERVVEMRLLFLLSILWLGVVMGSEWVQMEIERSHPVGGNFIHEEEIQYREALTWEHQADAELEHRLVFQVKQAKRAEFEKLLLDIGNPESERFGMEVTADMIHSMTKNPEGEDIIVDYLRAGGVRITTQEPGFITAAAPVRVWNDVLRADFHMVHSGKPHLSVPRTRTYSLPSNVAQHVEMVLNTVQLPLLVDLEEEPAFTAQFSNSTSLSTDEFSATILQTSEMYDGDDAALLEL